MNKDELDPYHGNLRQIQILAQKTDALARTAEATGAAIEMLMQENISLRAENSRLRTLLEQTTVMKNEE